MYCSLHYKPKIIHQLGTSNDLKVGTFEVLDFGGLKLLIMKDAFDKTRYLHEHLYPWGPIPQMIWWLWLHSVCWVKCRSSKLWPWTWTVFFILWAYPKRYLALLLSLDTKVGHFSVRASTDGVFSWKVLFRTVARQQAITLSLSDAFSKSSLKK